MTDQYFEHHLCMTSMAFPHLWWQCSFLILPQPQPILSTIPAIFFEFPAPSQVVLQFLFQENECATTFPTVIHMTLFTSLKKDYYRNVHIAINSFTPSMMLILRRVHVGKKRYVFINASWHQPANSLPLKFPFPLVILELKMYQNFDIWVEFWIPPILMTKQLTITSRMLGHDGDAWCAS